MKIKTILHIKRRKSDGTSEAWVTGYGNNFFLDRGTKCAMFPKQEDEHIKKCQKISTENDFDLVISFE